MKTNIKIELGILIFCLLGSFIFQLYVKSVSELEDYSELAYTELTEDQTYYIKPYQSLEIDMNADVIYKKGAPKIEIKTAEGWLEALTIEENDGTLIVELPSKIKGSNKYKSQLVIFNDQPLEELTLRSTVNMDYQYSDSLSRIDIHQGQVSKLRGKIKASFIDLDMSDASTCELTGAIEELTLKMRNASRAQMKDFVVSNLELDMSDDARGSLTVKDFITAESRGASRMEITGSPRIRGFSTRDASAINFLDNVEMQE